MDISSLPSNSHKSKEQQKYNLPEKKVEKVVTGETSIKRRSGIVKLADVFLPEDIQSVKSYILADVIIPKIKDVLHDIGSEAWDSFWGISGRSTRGSASKYTYVSYDKKYGNPDRDPRDQHPRRSGRLDYDEIVFNSRGDAETVLERMDELCERYQQVSVADMYDLSDVTNDNWMLTKYGWTDTRDARIERLSGGKYRINMPKARPLD